MRARRTVPPPPELPRVRALVLFGAELTHAYAATSGSRRNAGIDGELPHKADA